MKTKIGIGSFLLLFFCALIFKPLFAQSTDEAALLPNAVQQFLDNNGNPLSSGKVYFYEVGTTTFKDTYSSSTISSSTVNPNPITLNAGGKAPTGGIYGSGLYRQVVRDRNNNLIWDAVTAPGGGSSSPTNVGDGNLVGTILPWSGLVAPNQYVFAYGQEITRAGFPEFFTAITQQANVICSSGSNVLTGLADTTQIKIGSPIELALCVSPGTIVVNKTSATVIMSNASSVSINAVATFFPWGNGNGSTSFNVPDLRGYVLAGRNNMGGTASSRLTNTYFGNTPDALGATGGSQFFNFQVPNVLAVSAGILSAASFSSLPITTIQPTTTINYVIKVTVDTPASEATGVAAINGMTGTISCGAGLTCTGNIINTVTVSPTTLTLVGTGWGLTGGPCTVTCTVSVATSNPAFQFGNAVNLSLTASVTANSLTVSAKANDGTDPSVTNPLLIPYRSNSGSLGTVTWTAVTTGISLNIPAGATLGTTNSVPFRYWLVAVNSGGTTKLCVINTLSNNSGANTNIYPLGMNTAITTSGIPANATQTFYCGDAVSTSSYTIIGYITYESGLATAGQYASVPTIIQLYGPGVPLPGQTIQTQTRIITQSTTGATAIPQDNTIPTSSEGNEFMSQNILTVSAANILDISSVAYVSNGSGAAGAIALFKDSATDAMAVGYSQLGAGASNFFTLHYQTLTSAISTSTFRVRIGAALGTNTLNGVGGTGQFGGTMASNLSIREIMR